MKQLSRNILVALISKLLLISSGIVAQRFILRSFGSDINGLTSSVAQFLSYFTLLEAGLGLASIQVLYKPLAMGNQSIIDGILTATSMQYRRIGFIFFGLTLALSCTIPFISHSELDHGLIFGITMLMGMSNVLNYLFNGHCQTLLSADRKVYIIHTIDAVLGISFAVIRIILINVGYSIIVIQMAALISPIIRIIIFRIYVKQNYPLISYKAEMDYTAINKRKHVLVHQIAGMVTNNTDVTILTLFSTLSYVSVYSVYNLIYSNINNVISVAFSTAVQASFGRMIERQDKNMPRSYELYELLFTCMLFCLMSSVLVMTVPFVYLYTEGVTGVNYIDKYLAILFMISMLLNTVRIPAITLVNAYGNFQETKRGAVIEACINMSISIPAYLLIGMRGLLIGTCIAMAYRVLDIQIYTYSKIINQNLWRWLKIMCLNVLLSSTYVFFFMNLNPVEVNNWGAWVLAGVKCMAIAIVWFGVICGVVYRKKLIEIHCRYHRHNKIYVSSTEKFK